VKRSYISILLSIALLLVSTRAGMCQQVEKGATENLAQASASLDVKAEKVKVQVQKLGVAHKITVIFKDGDERYGSISQMSEQGFEIVEVDQQRRVSIRYEEVKKVRGSYGERNMYGKRVNQKVNFAIFGAILGFLIIAVPLMVPKT
jgi:hypothetical protein